MTDPGLHDDDGRDLRTALGGLLVDEPTAPWSVQDDVRRGQALRTRRRTRVLGAVGVVAAVALVAAVVGPMRPGPPSSPSAAPSEAGVPQAWLDRITPALQDEALLAVDWEASTVTGSVAAGFTLDLTTVPVELRSASEPRYVLADRTSTARLVLQWIPGGTSPGPALARCSTAACPQQGRTGVVGGSVDLAATAGASSTYPEGTQITDRQYASGLLELISYPDVPVGGGASATRSPLEGQAATRFLDAIGDPSQVRTVSPLSSAEVSDLLTTLGWRVDNVTDVRVYGTGPTVRKWNVSKDDGGLRAALVVRAWPPKAWPPKAWPTGGQQAGSLLDDCGSDRCGQVTYTIPDCAADATCWAEAITTLPRDKDAAAAGTRVLLTTAEQQRIAVEAGAGPIACATCSLTTTTPFLGDAELRQVVGVVQKQLLALAGPVPDPSSSPVVDGRACTSDDVKLVPGPDTALGYADAARILVTVYPRNPEVDCTLTPYPTVAGLDRDGAVLQYGQDNSGLAQSVHLGKGDVALFRVAAPICAPVGGDLAALRVTLAGGGDPLDVSVSMLVPLVSCAVGATPSSDLRVFAYEPVVGDPPTGDPVLPARG